MHSIIKTILFAALAFLPSIAFGQVADSNVVAELEGCVIAKSPAKTITNAQMAGVGATQILDTYLSPEKYSGTELRYISHTRRERSERNWSRLLLHEGRFAYVSNRANNADEMAGSYRFGYGLIRSWQILGGKLVLRAGAQADAYVGFLYNTRNGNNPAQAQISVDLSPNLAATYNFRLFRKTCQLNYEVAAPLLGLAFSPNYGQSYYEIFSRGDYDRNVVPTTFLSSPSLRHTLTFDMTLGRTTLRVGYLGDYRQQEVNNLKYHAYSNILLIGIVRRFQIVKLIP